MVRTITHDKAYYDDLIGWYDETVNKFEEALLTRKLEVDHRSQLSLSIYSLSLNKTIALYSRRDSLEAVVRQFLFTLQKLTVSDFDFGYWDSLTLISLGILLEIPDEEFTQLVAAVEKRGFLSSDQLLDYLISYRIPNRKINDKLQFPKPYASLISATTWGKSIAQTTLKTYLEKKWYPGHSDCGWHDSHKSPHNTYFGYWSFETAAIVKIMELDDSSFKDNQYYPYDLVHWKE